eukprot:8619634-Lingulodinium_polyedra.AAC.1
MREHSAAVQAAKVKELLTWQHYQRFSRKPRKHAATSSMFVGSFSESGLKTLGRRSVSFVRASQFE